MPFILVLWKDVLCFWKHERYHRKHFWMLSHYFLAGWNCDCSCTLILKNGGFWLEKQVTEGGAQKVASFSSPSKPSLPPLRAAIDVRFSWHELCPHAFQWQTGIIGQNKASLPWGFCQLPAAAVTKAAYTATARFQRYHSARHTPCWGVQSIT